MEVARSEKLPVRASTDLVVIRQKVRELAVAAGFSLVDQTKLVTAASELARNTLEHGKGGESVLELLLDGGRKGVRMVFVDTGPGIPDIALALKDGYTSGGGMGLGLGGAKRLVHDFDIQSAVGQGTRITATRWK